MHIYTRMGISLLSVPISISLLYSGNMFFLANCLFYVLLLLIGNHIDNIVGCGNKTENSKMDNEHNRLSNRWLDDAISNKLHQSYRYNSLASWKLLLLSTFSPSSFCVQQKFSYFLSSTCHRVIVKIFDIIKETA